MANEKFTALPTVASSTTADIICAVQGGVSSQETLAQVQTLFAANIIQNNAGNPNGSVAGTVYRLCWDRSNNLMYVCTTSGNAATAVWTLAGSVAFPITMANGGTGKALTASNGGLVYTDADSMEILAGTATAGQIPRSGANSAPSWSTSTYPATNAINTLLYASSANVMAALATVNRASLSTNATGVPTWLALTDGQVVIGSTAGAPAAASLSAGPGVSISSGSNTITISGTGSGIGWTEVTGATQAMTADNGYVANRATLVTFTLPVTAAFGTATNVLGKGAGGWQIDCGGGQNIQVGSVSGSTSVASTNRYDAIELICTTANTTWTAISLIGTLTIT